MDAKRIIAMVQVQGGRAAGTAPGTAACRLELAGADEILFVEAPRGPREDGGWIAEAAGAIFIPFAVERTFQDLAEVVAALEAGADKVVLAADAAGLGLLPPAVQRFGRTRLAVAVTAFLDPGGAWKASAPDAPEGRDALGWMIELGLLGAGELLVRTEGPAEAAAAFFQQAAQLASPVLRRAGGAEEAAQALAHGADGVVLPPTLSPADLKGTLAPLGLPIRR